MKQGSRVRFTWSRVVHEAVVTTITEQWITVAVTRMDGEDVAPGLTMNFQHNSWVKLTVVG